MKLRLPRIFRKDRQRPGKSIILWPSSVHEGAQRWLAHDLTSYSREGFEANSLIYSAIMYKVRSQQMAPLRAYTGDPAHPDVYDEDEPLAQLLDRPNPYQSWSEFQGLQTVFLNLSGNAYCYIEGALEGEFPTRLIPLRPDWVYHVPNERGDGLLGYAYAPGGDETLNPDIFLPQEIIHVKLPHPMDPLGGLGPGLSPIAPLAVSGDVDNMVTRFMRDFFTHGAMPIGFLTFKASLETEDMEAVRETWKDKYGGAVNWLDVAVLSDGGEYQRMGLTFEEMGFREVDYRNEARILSPFGVPPILLGTRMGLEHATLRNAEEARRIFWEDTFIPELMLFEVEYRSLLDGRGTWVAFDMSQVPALQEDVPRLIEAATALWKMGYPAHIASQAVGLNLPDIPTGDMSFLPQGMVPAEQLIEPPQAPPGLPPGLPPGVNPEDLDPEVEKALRDLLRKGGAGGAQGPDPFRPEHY